MAYGLPCLTPLGQDALTQDREERKAVRRVTMWVVTRATKLQLPIAFALVAMVSLRVSPHLEAHRVLADALSVSRAPTGMNGPLLIAAVRPGARDESLLAISPGRGTRVLIPHLPLGVGLGASPRGRYIALAEGRQGLWLVKSDGTGLSRRLLPPSPTQRLYPLVIKAVAWSPDRYTLAYVVGEDISSAKGPGQAGFASDTHVGVWVARYDSGSPRQVATDAQLGDVLSVLSWSSDGQHISIGDNGATYAIAVSSGRVSTLPGNGSGTFSPTDPLFAYVPQGRQSCTSDDYKGGTAVCTIDEQGKRRVRMVGHDVALGDPAFNYLVWSPNGRDLAYLAYPDAVHTLDITTGQVRVVRLGSGWRLGNGLSLAWLRTRI